MRFGLIGLLASLCQAQPVVLSPDANLLAAIQAKVADHLTRLPNYTCLEHIRRERRSSSGQQFQHYDSVRLQVALVEGKEMFGWPGGNRIAESEISRLVRGTIGT